LDATDLDALAAVPELARLQFARDFRACRLGLEAVGTIDEVAPRLCGPARAWQSFTPFAPARHGKRRTPWAEHVRDEVIQELGYRGLPVPTKVVSLRGPWLSFRRHRARQSLRDARRAVGLRIEFSRPVEGPIALGALSHFGLGLFLPMEG
jgi:CRISPR-associated protein Csb2